MNNRKLAKMEKKLPEIALAALNAASRRADESGLPSVVVIENGLYRIHASGEKELIRMLPPRTKVTGRVKRSKT